ncbi:MAG: [protein-PII] uridylyltransferase [Planctomycetota bacterium]|jgi:[protein-PII] uridylyltransferase
MSRLGTHVLAARRRLAEGQKHLSLRHEEGRLGADVCAAICDLRDRVVLDLYAAALDHLRLGDPGALGDRICLVAHGGYGRRDVAPFSDIDLMILVDPKAADPVARIAKRLVGDVFDAGLVLGHSVRTPQQACRLACHDPEICTSLIESRFLAGSQALFDRFLERFHRVVGRRGPGLVDGIERARLNEQIQFGRTVYLVEPNLKRSRGGLRDVQLLRWVGMVRYGTREPDDLGARGLLPEEDLHSIRQAAELLLWLRNEMHFHAGKASDVLSRSEQVRIAERLGCQAASGMLPVETFMRDYFRHTGRVSQVVARFLTKARSPGRLKTAAAVLFGHRLPDGFRVGPAHVTATGRGLKRLRGNLDAIMQLVDLANLCDKPIAPDTWEVVCREAVALPDEISPRAVRHCHSLLAHPARLADLLRGLHEARLLERFIPAFGHARGLMQFNQYHSYTVDEHCFQAVEAATHLLSDAGPLGTVYRGLRRKLVLHLALLIHDLGKGRPEDHCEVGLRIAQDAADRLGLHARDTDDVKFLVHKHLLMNHLAFRRDTGEEQVVLRFAVEVGSPELLGMLYVLTACDLTAVGPDVWTGWKAELLTDLYGRAMQHLAGDSPALTPEELVRERRRSVAECLGRDHDLPWFRRHVDTLSGTYLTGTEPRRIAADLRLLRRLGKDDVDVRATYLPATETIRLTVGTHEAITPGIFHKLCGALSGQGLEILSAEINTLAEGLVIDRFQVRDPDYAGQSPPERIEQIHRSLEASLRGPGGASPPVRRTWQIGGHQRPPITTAQSRVGADNSTSETHTILDVFAADRAGLLFAVARTLFECGLSVGRARIATYGDQAVDVFYVTDAKGNKIEDPARLDDIRRRLLDVILLSDNRSS